VSPATIVYTSSDATVATVDANGVVTGVAEGEATITASVAEVDYWTAASASYKVIVKSNLATITTPPVATAGDIIAGSATALVTAGVADGGTMMYEVTATNTKPTTTDGFSATIPTAATLAAGTYYVWYYAKGNTGYNDSEIAAAAVEVTVSPAGPTLSTPLTIEAMEAGATVTFKALNSAPARDIQYSTDGGATWTDGNTGGTGVSVVLANVGDRVMFRGETTNYATGNNSDYNNIGCDKNIKVYGNIMSLIQKTGFETLTTLTAANAFRRLFRNNTKLIDASNLLLPAATLTNSCYRGMFQGCTNLTAAPKELPATSLADNCYIYMFDSCNKLTTVPVELPATEMKQYCYCSMFDGCISLTTAPKLPATTLANFCYTSMFYGCSSLTEAWVKADYNDNYSECSAMFAAAAATGTIHSKTGSNWGTQKGAAGIGGWTVNEDYND